MRPARSERPQVFAPITGLERSRPSLIHLASDQDEAAACPVQSLHERLMQELAPPPPTKARFDPIWLVAAIILGGMVWGLYVSGQALLHGWR
jgi:hypothetical protein